MSNSAEASLTRTRSTSGRPPSRGAGGSWHWATKLCSNAPGSDSIGQKHGRSTTSNTLHCTVAGWPTSRRQHPIVSHPVRSLPKIRVQPPQSIVRGEMFKTFMSMFSGDDAPRPHDVAEAIVKLVGQAKGTRPDRIVVGRPFGADAVNTSVAPVQRQVVESLGLGALATIAGARATAA